MISKLKKFVAIFCMIFILLANTGKAFASDLNSDSPSVLSKYKVESLKGSMTEGEFRPAWLGYGPITRYPAEGGSWKYGFWNSKVRSYYTVDRCHGSTVKLNGKINRSIDTEAGYQSKAEIWTLQHNGDDSYYYRVCD